MTTFTKNLKAFTVMELMVVVIIISILAAFIIPNYQNSLARAHEKDIVANLRAIKAAQEIYRAENGVYWTANAATATINATLRLGIIENNTTYQCVGVSPDFACFGYPAGTPFIVAAYSAVLNGEPYCASAPGSCPTCLDVAGGGCPN